MQFSDSHETGQEHVRPIITKKLKKYEIIFGIKENKANLYVCNLNIFAISMTLFKKVNTQISLSQGK